MEQHHGQNYRPWAERILGEFVPGLSRFWIVADPDDILLDEHILTVLRERSFEVIPFEDSITFRSEYEERFRASWDRGDQAPADALILHLRSADADSLPWDYLRQARRVSLSLGDLFPALSYPVLRELDTRVLSMLYQVRSSGDAKHPLGDAATRDFILERIYHLSPHTVTRQVELWHHVLRLHYRGDDMPQVLASRIQDVIGKRKPFAGLPVEDIFAQRPTALRVVQAAWYREMEALGVKGDRMAEPAPPYLAKVEIPFDHPDIRSYVASMFLEGILHPIAVTDGAAVLPDWAKPGVVPDPDALYNLVREGTSKLPETIPAAEASYRDWVQFAQRRAEITTRFYALDPEKRQSLQTEVDDVRRRADEAFTEWLARQFGNLPSLPIAKGPVMVHHIPRYLAMQRSDAEEKVALVVLDGVALDQWVQIRESFLKTSVGASVEDEACFAWLPTLTSVSRQAIFSGLRPREFAESIDKTHREPNLWKTFWRNNGVSANQVLYRKSVKRNEDLTLLEEQVSDPALRVVGIVVDTVDEIVHGAVLGKQSIAGQIEQWCNTGFFDHLFRLLHRQNFRVYVTSDHGNIDAVGIGRLDEGQGADVRGHRVRTYRTDALIAKYEQTLPGLIRFDISALPLDFKPLFAGGTSAFLPEGEHAVVHGGVSIEEVIVPFVRVTYSE